MYLLRAGRSTVRSLLLQSRGSGFESPPVHFFITKIRKFYKYRRTTIFLPVSVCCPKFASVLLFSYELVLLLIKR